MADSDLVRDFGRLLGGAARAHHEAVGGPSPTWPEWYASHLHPDIAQFVGYQPSVEEIAGWLREADERYQAEEPDMKWPYYYAELILGWVREG